MDWSKKTYFSYIFFLVIQLSFAQKVNIDVNVYQTSEDLINDKPTKQNAIAFVKEQSDEHIWVKKIVDQTSLKKLKKSEQIWALEYKGAIYYNLLYSIDSSKPNVYIKLDLIGKFCTAYIDKSSPKRIDKNTIFIQAQPNGIGFYKSIKKHDLWKNINGDFIKILFIDTSIKQKSPFGLMGGSTAKYLTRKKLQSIIQDTSIDVNTLSFEDAIILIKNLNTEAKIN